jgi:predicted MFS family arabinose efflux permease
VPLTRWLAHRFRIARTPVGAGSLTLGGQSLFASLIISALCTVLLLLLPFVAARSRRTHAVEHAPGDDDARMSRRRALLYALYFACLGLGFIMVEIVLIQRFNLFFGYPVYSLSVVLFTILLASGLGSVIAGRWAEARNLRRALIALCVLLLLYAAALPVLLDALLGESTPARIVIAVALIAPLGILLGMPFPTGLRFAGRESKSLVSWAWAANGVASVFGSTLAVLISMTYGFDASFLTGAGAYLLALVLISSLQMQFVVNRES